jgi:hypothetical protein
MRHQAEAVARRRSAQVDLDLEEEATAVPVAADLLLVAVTSAAADPEVVLVAPVVVKTSAAVGLVVRTSTTVDLAALVDLVALVTSVDLAVRVGLAAQVTSVARGVLVTSTVAVPVTSDRDLLTPSAASAANRGAMEPRLGAGAHRLVQAGAGRSLHREEPGTRVRSTTSATTSSRSGIRAKTVGASTSSECGFRCNS